MKLEVEVVDEVGVQLLLWAGGWWVDGWVGGWMDKTKVILNSTQIKFKFKFKLKLEVSLEINY